MATSFGAQAHSHSISNIELDKWHTLNLNEYRCVHNAHMSQAHNALVFTFASQNQCVSV